MQNDDWPADEQTATAPPPPVTTVVMSPPPPVAPAPFDREPSDGISLPMLAGIVLVAAAVAAIAVLLLTDRQGTSPTTTVVVTTPAARAPATARAAPTKLSVAIPDLVGQTQGVAATALKNEGLIAKIVAVPGPPPAGRVTAQSFAPGQKLRSGTIVRLNVSNGVATSAKPAAAATTSSPAATVPATTTQAVPEQPATVDVPGVSGDVKTAAQTLGQAGFLVSIQYIPGSDPLGTVENQGPAAGTRAPAGSHVTINASSGPGHKVQETVPDASGQTIPQAVSTMQHAGLRLIFLKKTVTDQSLAGKIVEQTPPAGHTAPKNAQVLVYMGAFK
jgi:beta-lactam-binding protein with PASTA domain